MALKVSANVGMDSEEFWLRGRGFSLYRVYPNMESIRLGEEKKQRRIKFQNLNTHLQHILTNLLIIWELSKKPEEYKNHSALSIRHLFNFASWYICMPMMLQAVFKL